MKVIYLILIFVAMLFSVATTFAQDETIRVETDLVTVNVAVADKQGKPVKNLRQEQFEIFDNRTKQQISYFSAEDAPVTYGIIYDMHPTTTERTTAVLESLRSFTKKLRDEDRFFLIAFNQKGSLSLDFIPTPEQIEKNLPLGAKPRELNSLYDAIYEGADRLSESKSPKRTLLVISDSADDRSRHSISDLRNRFKTFDAQIYAVIFDESQMWAYSDVTRGGERRKRISNDADQLDRATLQELTMRSGGTANFPATENTVELLGIYNQIAAEMRDFYTLSFYPSAKDGKWHNLHVDLHSVEGYKKFALTYRQGYRSPLPTR
jgi:Ca-activated chloride channel homolog